MPLAFRILPVNFSGTNVAVQVTCGVATRTIQTRVLERDWFLAHPARRRSTVPTLSQMSRKDEPAARRRLRPTHRKPSVTNPNSRSELGSGTAAAGSMLPEVTMLVLTRKPRKLPSEPVPPAPKKNG
jgi:hypothetical protein